jgi:putative ABC transport system substrate-binding protein
MNRRDFMTLLAGAAVGWPLAAQAQQRTMPVIGFLSDSSPDQLADALTSFRQGLGDTGYVDGRNVAIEYRWAAGQVELLPQLAADLVRRQVAVIVAFPSRPIVAAKGATSTIPIVFSTGVDPVRFGLVQALNRPGGNLTGFSLMTGELVAKHLQLLREVAPNPGIMAALIDRNDPNRANVSNDLQTAARTLGVPVDVLYAGNDRELEEVFAKLSELRPAGLIISTNAFLRQRYKQMSDFTIRHGIPAIGPNRPFAMAGGLMTYSAADPADAMRVIGGYAGRILKGEKPADLPVAQPTKFELVINLKTAKALGLTIPAILQATADEVIE